MAKISHSKLVNAAKMWLQVRCKTVATELTGVGSEIPDSIGWTARGDSLLIECKASRSDFLSDKKKMKTSSGFGMGRRRWCLVPPGLVQVNELPEGWGLLEYRPSKHSAGYYIREILLPVYRVDGEFKIPESREKLMLITIAKRALEALRLVKPLSYGLLDEAIDKIATNMEEPCYECHV